MINIELLDGSDEIDCFNDITFRYQDEQMHPEIYELFDEMFEGDDRIEVYT